MQIASVFLGIVLFFTMSCTGFGGRTAEERALLHLKMGISYLNSGNYPAALGELLKAEKYDRNNFLIQNNLSLAYFVRKKYALAERHARQSLDIKPSFTEGRNNLARILIEQGAYKEAIRELKGASLDLTYQYPDKTFSNLGMAYFKDKQYESALPSLKKSLEIRKDSCITSNYYGRTLYEMKKFKEAALAFDQSIKLCKKAKFDEPTYYSAICYYKIGQPEESIARFEELIKKFPKGAYVDKAKGMLDIVR